MSTAPPRPSGSPRTLDAEGAHDEQQQGRTSPFGITGMESLNRMFTNLNRMGPTPKLAKIRESNPGACAVARSPLRAQAGLKGFAELFQTSTRRG